MLQSKCQIINFLPFYECWRLEDDYEYPFSCCRFVPLPLFPRKEEEGGGYGTPRTRVTSDGSALV